MKAKTLLSRIALMLAMILALSTLAACDLSDIFGNGSSEAEEEGKSSVKTYIYNDTLPSSIEEINEKAWKASSKIDLAEGNQFEPGMQVIHLGKIENQGKLNMNYQLYLNTKGDYNDIANYIHMSFVITDVNGYVIDETTGLRLGDFLGNKATFISSNIAPGEVHYVSIMFYMEEYVSATFDEQEIGAKIYLGCMASKISSEKDEFGSSSYDSGYLSGSGGGIYNSGIYETTTYNPDTNTSNNETDSAEPHYSDLYYGSYYSWTSSNHAPDSISSIGFVAQENGYFSFWYTVSSENGCDRLVLTVNGNECASFSGEYSNEYYYVYVNSGDRILLSYTKDSSVDNGSDSAYVYDIYLSSERIDTEEVSETDEASESEYETIESEEETSYPTLETVGFPTLGDGYLEYYNTSNFYCAEEVDYYGNHQYYYFFSDNHDDNSYAYLAFTALATGKLSFECRVPSETNCDRLIVTVNGSTVYVDGHGEYCFSGTYEWNGAYDFYVKQGDTIEFVYSKDGSVSNGEDRAYIRNITFYEGETEYIAPSYPEYEFPSETAPIDECVYVESNDFFSRDFVDEYGNIRIEYYADAHDNYARASMTLVATQTGTLYFEALPSSENGCDGLYVYINDQSQNIFISGEATEYVYHLIYVRKGDIIRFEYAKDGSVNSGNDTVYIGNFNFMPDTLAPESGEFEILDTEYFSSYTYENNGEHHVWYSTNQFSYNDSTAYLYLFVPSNGYITFDYTVSSEEYCDHFIIIVDNEEVYSNSGNAAETDVSIYVDANSYVYICYSKDGNNYAGTDQVTITDLTFIPEH